MCSPNINMAPGIIEQKKRCLQLEGHRQGRGQTCLGVGTCAAHQLQGRSHGGGKCNLVLVEHAMVDSVPPVQDPSHLQDPGDSGLDVWVAHHTPGCQSSLSSSHPFSCSHIKHPCGPVFCLWAGAFPRLV